MFARLHQHWRSGAHHDKLVKVLECLEGKYSSKTGYPTIAPDEYNTDKPTRMDIRKQLIIKAQAATMSMFIKNMEPARRMHSSKYHVRQECHGCTN